jgi:L-cysteate sulfo-lyase
MTGLDLFPRVRLGHLPTPLDDAKRLALAIGLSSLLIKRDDCTGFGGGGNKVRKLEFLLAEAARRQLRRLGSAFVVNSC